MLHSDSEKWSQVYTPDAISALMASWIDTPSRESVRVLDPGAGLGNLSEHVAHRLSGMSDVSMDLVEIDPFVAEHLREEAAHLGANSVKSFKVDNCDYLETIGEKAGFYDIIVMNPPYRKLSPKSAAGARLRAAGIFVTNEYAAFLWIGIDQLADGGQLIAIVPRSFFNGTHFTKLRQKIAAECDIQRIHTFASRDGVFARDQVLQETVIVKLRKTGDRSTTVRLSQGDGNDDDWQDVPSALVFDRTSNEPVVQVIEDVIDRSRWHQVGDFFRVRTGPVVQFRTMTFSENGQGRVPLYDATWFRTGSFSDYVSTEHGGLLPPGRYVLVKRFSPSEQRPRLLVRIVQSPTQPVAVENRVNVIATRDPEPLFSLDYLIDFLQTEEAENQFRARSGSTQVNATDLRALRIPPVQHLSN